MLKHAFDTTTEGMNLPLYPIFVAYSSQSQDKGTQDTESPPVITIDNYELDAVCQFTYLGSTITDNLSLDAEIDKRIGMAASTLARLTARVWSSPKLFVKTKKKYGGLQCLCYQHMFVWQRDIDYIYRAGDSCPVYVAHVSLPLENRLNTFHLGSIRGILGI